MFKNRPGGFRVFNLMEKRTESLPFDKAGIIQRESENLNCEIIEIAPNSKDTVRVSVQGTAENIEALFSLIKEKTTEDE